MAERSRFTFADYVVDCENEQLLLHHHPLSLTLKAFAVLRYLVTHAGQLVTKDALLTAVWPKTVVSETTLTNCIGELRRALGDEPTQPRFIETVHRRGYRFIAPLHTPSHQELGGRDWGVDKKPQQKIEQARDFPKSLPPPTPQLLPPVLVGREAELTQLHGLFAKALNGERQIVFVTGEAGIGKTSLIETFLQQLAASVQKQEGKRQKAKGKGQKAKVEHLTPSTQHPAPIFVAWGQCIEQYGAGEAYLPVLEALGRLGRGPQKARVLTVLQQYAPTWLVQLPALLSTQELEAVHRRTQGATRERMLREIVDALDVLSAEQPVILVLEDLHWSDPSTVELLVMLARRREPTQLLVLSTYRAAELVVGNHPLKTVKHELVARRHATELALSFLSPAAVRAYVGQRLPGADAIGPLAQVIYQRTDGQPLFMVHVTDYLLERGGVIEQHRPDLLNLEQRVPQGLWAVIAAQLARLTEDEHNVLAVGSVNGAEFTVTNVAAGLGQADATIEALCDRLATRSHFIVERGVHQWPDGTVSGRYGFRHALYQEVLYMRLPEVHQIRWHKAIGERIERGYGERTSEVAAELAVHFERGHDNDRAVVYLQKAGENALRRNAYQEALGYFHKGAAFLLSLPDTVDRARRELALQFLLIQAIAPVKGHASVEVEHAYLRALTLCEQIGTTQQLFFVRLGLFLLRHGHCEYQQARELGAQCLALAQREHDPALFLPAYYALGASELYLGNFAIAKDYLTQGIRCYERRYDATYFALYGNASPYAFCHGYAAMALWYLGYPDQAVQGIAEMMRIATELATPLMLVGMKGFVPLVHHGCRHGAHVQAQAEEGIAVATQLGLSFWRAIGLFWRGWSLAEQGHYEDGISQMQEALSAQHATGSTVHRVHFSVLLAEAHGNAGQYEAGLRLLAEAQIEMERTNERFYEAELWRIKGELTRQQGARRWELGSSLLPCSSPNPKSQIPAPASETEVEECFLNAIAVARQQQAKSLELRAVMSLVRLRQQQIQDALRNTHHDSRSKLAEAHTMLSEVYTLFTEGFDTKDLQEAKALLETLRGNGATGQWDKG